MKNVRRTTALLLSATMVTALALAGCAPGGGSTEPSAQDEGPSTLDPQMEGDIQYWGWQAASSIAGEIAAFNEVYPNIEVTYKQLSNEPKYGQELTPGLLSNAGPDIFMLAPGAPAVTYSPYARDLTGLAEQQLGEDWKSKVSPLGVDFFTVDEKLVAASTGSSSSGTWLVNQTMLAELGLDVPDELMTLDELVDFCDTVKAAGVDCLSLGGQAFALTGGQFQSIAESVAPGKYTEAVNGTLPWTDPDLVEALGIMQSLYTDGVFQEGAVGDVPYPDVWKEFLEQKAAMTVLGSWTLGDYTKSVQTTNLEANGLTAADGFTILLIPSPDLAGSGTVPQLPTAPGAGDAISLKTKNLAAAEAYIAWKQFSPEGQQYIANTLSFLPSMNGIAPEGLDLVNPELQGPSLKSIIDAAAVSEVSWIIACADVTTAVSDAMQKIGIGEDPVTVAQGIQDATESIDRSSCN